MSSTEHAESANRAESPALSPSSTLVDSTPRSPVRHRPTFARLASVLDGDRHAYDAVKLDDDITEAIPHHEEDQLPRGLGISIGPEPARPLPRNTSTSSIPRVAVGSKISLADSPATPGSADPLLHSPHSASGTFPKSALRHASNEPDVPYWSSNHHAKRSVSSFQSSIQPNYVASSDAQPLRSKSTFAESLRSVYNDFTPSVACATHKHFYQGRANYLLVTILVLSVYSTVFSALYLIIAFRGPRYGHIIHTGGVVSESTASLLAALFAKTIELSFVTVFVAFLGQVLSRRAFMKDQKGVNLAEFNMRSWVVQPGSLVTHAGSIRYAALSFLGILSLLATIAAMLYTTASDALVQPQLKFGKWEPKLMRGLVMASYANPQYLEKLCKTPIPSASDPTYGGTTCLQIQYAAQSYHNYQRYLADWDDVAGQGNGSIDLANRPGGFALLYENTTVTADWIEIVDTANVSKVAGRTINNVTMAMPHAGVLSAARDGINDILQPEDLDGLGIYSVHASVPSPAINVLCASMTEDDLAPIVYSEWNSTEPFDASLWPSPLLDFYDPAQPWNKTVVDDVFGWGPGYNVSETMTVPRPVFPKLPLPYNTILNGTGVYGREAIYLLGQSPTAGYALCSVKAFLTPYCSTRYNASRSGGTLEAICEDSNDNMQYIHSMPNATTGIIPSTKDYVSGIASEWGNSLSLNAGISDGNASNSRLLTQLILSAPQLSAALPSMAEALAVMAGSTLLMSTENTPFVEFWNYSAPMLEEGQYQYFNASLRAQQYASGGTENYQRGFYAVLVVVFVINVICLGYFVTHKGLVTDFSEPPNLFSLAVNSPPSGVMAGSCGGGPHGKQYGVPWHVNAEGDHLFMENSADKFGDEHGVVVTGREQMEVEGSPVQQMFDKFSRRRSRL